MSDYGFVTYDEKTGKKRLGSINSKWPIFGPKYNDIKTAFKTYFITDTYTQPYVSSPDVVMPPAGGYQENMKRGVVKTLVATIPHGYNFRPVGYATFAGTFRKNVRSKWDYKRLYDASNQWAPSTTLYNTDTTDIPSVSDGDGYIHSTKLDSSISEFDFNLFTVNYPSNVYYYLKNPEGLFVTNIYGGEYVYPFVVEIDETNIYIYRNTYWVDKYGRFYYSGSSDLTARSQGVVDWAGSNFELTIYLAPYSMEDLI